MAIAQTLGEVPDRNKGLELEGYLQQLAVEQQGLGAHVHVSEARHPAAGSDAQGAGDGCRFHVHFTVGDVYEEAEAARSHFVVETQFLDIGAGSDAGGAFARAMPRARAGRLELFDRLTRDPELGTVGEGDVKVIVPP